MTEITDALVIAGLGITVVFAVLVLLLLATRGMSFFLAPRRVSPEEARETGQKEPPVNPDHLAVITAVVLSLSGRLPDHMTVRKLD